MLKYIVSVLIYLALSVQIGSVLFFGFGVAPTLFRQELIPGQRLIPSNTLAGAINSAILSRLGMIEMAACVVLLLGAVYVAFRYEQWMNWVVLALSLGMLAGVYYSTTVLFPRVDQLRKSIGSFDSISTEKTQAKVEFDEGHAQYSGIAKIILFAAVLTLILHTAGLVRYAESMSEAAQKATHLRAAPEISHAPVAPVTPVATVRAGPKPTAPPVEPTPPVVAVVTPPPVEPPTMEPPAPSAATQEPERRSENPRKDLP